MKKKNIIRAWKDEEYRESLSDAERATLPENPVGLTEFSNDDLRAVYGGNEKTPVGTVTSWKICSYDC